MITNKHDENGLQLWHRATIGKQVCVEKGQDKYFIADGGSVFSVQSSTQLLSFLLMKHFLLQT